jgi:riboflavin kinase/FMN adenylyltransferase
MRLYDHIETFDRNAGGVSLAIGNFDGVHPGHVRIVREAVREGAKRRIPAGVLTFQDHPKNILAEKRVVDFILSPRAKLERLRAQGIDFCIMAREKRGFWDQSPGDFIRSVLSDSLNARFIAVGKNFRFGKNASGRTGDLERFSQGAFNVSVLPLVERDGEVLSSTRIRRSIEQGRFEEANRLLNERIFFSALAVPGKRIGRDLGFPTANLAFPEIENLETGVYAVRAWIENRPRFGAANVGVSPSIGPENAKGVEVHFPGFPDRDLYGTRITLEFLEKLREEKTFSTREALSAQIRKDVETVRRRWMASPGKLPWPLELPSNTVPPPRP